MTLDELHRKMYGNTPERKQDITRIAKTCHNHFQSAKKRSDNGAADFWDGLRRKYHN